jgi:hypothetical protein
LARSDVRGGPRVWGGGRFPGTPREEMLAPSTSIEMFSRRIHTGRAEPPAGGASITARPLATGGSCEPGARRSASRSS